VDSERDEPSSRDDTEVPRADRRWQHHAGADVVKEKGKKKKKENEKTREKE